MSDNVFQQQLDTFYRHIFTTQSRLYPDGTLLRRANAPSPYNEFL